MTVTVLEEWGVNNCRDFGEIVFNMVESGLLQKPKRTPATIFSRATISQTPSANPSGPASKMKAAGKPVVKRET